MHRIIPILFFLFCLTLLGPIESQAQIRHEVKSDVFGLISTQPNLYWEVVTDQNFGFELGAQYTFTTISFNTFFNSSVLQAPSYFYREYFTLFGSARYYFFPKKKGHGLYSGVQSFFKVNTALDEDYEKIYEEVFDQRTGIGQSKDWFLGIPIGYKWLIKDRFIVEPGFLFGGEITWLNGVKYWGFSAELRLQVGYRFPSNKPAKLEE